MAVPTTTSRTPATVNVNGKTRVSLVGTGYTGTTGVTIAGVAATDVHVVDDTHINFLAPAHAVAASAAIVVTNATGASTVNLTVAYANVATATYAEPDGTADVTYFMDVALSPATVASGALQARLDTKSYPKPGVTAAPRVGTSAPAPALGV